MPAANSGLPEGAMRHGAAEPPAALGTSMESLGRTLRSDGFVWFFADLAHLPANLCPATREEATCAESLPTGAVRDGWLARRRLARCVIGEARGVSPHTMRIDADPLGRPFLTGEGQGLHLSFSARENLALIGIADRPLGVDLEIERADLSIPVNVLRAEERQWLAALPETRRIRGFLRIWTAKEAIVKCRGRGFRLAPERVLLPWPDQGNVDIRILPESLAPVPENSDDARMLVLTREGIRVFVSPSSGEMQKGPEGIGVAVACAMMTAPDHPDSG